MWCKERTEKSKDRASGSRRRVGCRERTGRQGGEGNAKEGVLSLTEGWAQPRIRGVVQKDREEPQSLLIRNTEES